jgi:hypothetical protein
LSARFAPSKWPMRTVVAVEMANGKDIYASLQWNKGHQQY